MEKEKIDYLLNENLISQEVASILSKLNKTDLDELKLALELESMLFYESDEEEL